MIVKKAGCILLNMNTKEIGLVYRKKQNDYTFPKGHLDENETLEQCAVRETEEEIGRKCHIIEINIPTIKYIDSHNDLSIVQLYIAKDDGKSKQVFDPSLVHEICWVPFSLVYDKLSYDNLKELWIEVKQIIKDILDKQP